jgi:NAD(P)H dehydrogenase (quinone)
VPAEIWGSEDELRARMVAEAGGPLRRAAARRWLRDKHLPELREVIAERRPRDVLAQQEKIARSDGLAFIAPIYWMNFPAILRGWMERVFTYGFVYSDSGCGHAIERLVDDFGFRYPGIENVEHVYFYAVAAVDEATRREYLQRAETSARSARTRNGSSSCWRRSAARLLMSG